MTVKLNYEKTGGGRPVLVLHGLFGSARNWRSMSKRLAENFEVISVDLRNHGESGHHQAMNYRSMAEDLDTFIHQHRIGPCSIIGHSMGGKVAMTVALLGEIALDRLVILDIAPVRYNNDFSSILDALGSLRLETLKSRKQASEQLSQALPDGNLRLFLLQNLQQGSAGFYWRINLQALKESLMEIGDFPEFPATSAFRGPSLFLGGADSAYIDHAYHGVILDMFPNAEIRELADAGHWLHADQPERVYHEILGFLNN